MMSNQAPPKYIYLQKHSCETEWDFSDMEGVTWSQDSIEEENKELRYILETFHLEQLSNLRQKNQELESAIKDLLSLELSNGELLGEKVLWEHKKLQTRINKQK